MEKYNKISQPLKDKVCQNSVTGIGSATCPSRNRYFLDIGLAITEDVEMPYSCSLHSVSWLVTDLVTTCYRHLGRFVQGL